MKRGLQLTVLFLLFFVGAYAQTVPQGMKYQAVARSLSGDVIANSSINLKISLLTNGTPSIVHYSEVHNVTTSALGLFNLVIGEGKAEEGTFAAVPWSTDNVWMEVSIKDKSSAVFTPISNTKLLAVPYAFHAGTASELTNSGNTRNQSSSASGGVPSAVWHLKGNSRTNPATDNLGTTDAADLVIITNDIERIRITANGDVAIKNKLQVAGIETVINTTQSTTPANGALVVTGGVGIGGNLNVGGETKFGGGITSKGISVTDNTENFVATITNTNEGEGDGLKIKLGRVHPLWNGTAYELIEAKDYNTVYGAFQEQIDLVGGWIKTKQVNFTPQDIFSLVKNTGSFIGGALCQLTNAISPILNEKIGLPLDFATPINNGLSLPLNLTKPINDGIGLPFDLTKPINTGLGLPVNFSILTVLNSAADLIVPDASLPGPSITLVPALPPLVIPAIPDLIIPKIPVQYLTIPKIPVIDCSSLFTIKMPTIRTTDVTNSLTNKNEFIRFADKDERVVGKIRARSIGDYTTYLQSNEYLFNLVAAVGGIDIARGLLSLGKEFKNLNENYNKLGVEYISGNGDYAEWMEREDLDETISAGDIVGVKGGKITKDLKGAEQIMAVSTAPIVNANMPNENKVALGNSIAFMGQIPVKIVGAVTTGDFVVAKGTIPGYGVAIKSSEMTTEDFRMVVGRAWETKAGDGPKMVNTLVGVQNNDFLKIIEKYQQKLLAAEERVSSTEERLNAIEQRLNINAASQKGSQKK